MWYMCWDGRGNHVIERSKCAWWGGRGNFGMEGGNLLSYMSQ